jgi:hypothetical protein
MCADLWNGRPPAGVPEELPLRVCRPLPLEQFVGVQEWLLDGLIRETAENAADRYKTLLRVLLERCREDQANLPLLTSALQAPRYTDELGRAVLRDGRLATELATAFPGQMAQLGACAAGVLDQLWSQGRLFREHFQMVRTVQAALPQSHRAPWHAWMGINQRLQELASLYASPPAAYNLLGRRAHGAKIREMGEALARDVNRALSGPEYTGKADAAGKAETVEEIARYVIAQNFPADFAACLTSALRNEGWVPAEVKSPAVPKPAPPVVAKPIAKPDPPVVATPVGKPEPVAAVTPMAKPEKVGPAAPRLEPDRVGPTPMVVIALAAVVVACAGFWVFGGVSWMRTRPGERTIVQVDPELPTKPPEIPAEPTKADDKSDGEKPRTKAGSDSEPAGDTRMDEGPRSPPVAGPETPDDADNPAVDPPEEKPVKAKPKDDEVAVATPPLEKHRPSKLKYPEQQLDAHKSSVVVAERLPVTLGLGEIEGNEQRLTGWPDNIDAINVYGPTILKEGVEPIYPSLKVSTSGKQLTLSLARNERIEVPALRVSFEKTLSIQCFSSTRKELARDIVEHLSTCVLEIRYPTYSRYGYLGASPKEETRDDKQPTVDMPLFCRWFGKESDWVAVSFWESDSKGKERNWSSLPCRIPQESGNGELQLSRAPDAKGGKLVLPRQHAKVKEAELMQLKDVPFKLINPVGKNWNRYIRLCNDLGLAPVPPIPKIPEKLETDDGIKDWENQRKDWNQKRNIQIIECDQRIKSISEELRRFELASKGLDVHCEVATVNEPQWDKSDGRLKSGIVHVIMPLRLQSRPDDRP